jgi:predicted TIM-barrel fold metal-dependent hydrolase
MIASACPRSHSPSHIGLDAVWAKAQEAGAPIVFHVGGGGQLLDPMYFENGLPPVPDFHGGAENFRSVDYMAIPYPPMQTLATMILDGVLERFPDLRIGVIEQGAWGPRVDAVDGLGCHRFREERGVPPEAVAEAERVRPTSGSGHAVSA